MLLNGGKITDNKAKEWGIAPSDDDDEEDSDFGDEYGYVGGDSATYDSLLDEKDEILFVKTVLQNFDQQTMQQMLSVTDLNDQTKFSEILNTIDTLIGSEKLVERQQKEIEQKKKDERIKKDGAKQ